MTKKKKIEIFGEMHAEKKKDFGETRIGQHSQPPCSSNSNSSLTRKKLISCEPHTTKKNSKFSEKKIHAEKKKFGERQTLIPK